MMRILRTGVVLVAVVVGAALAVVFRVGAQPTTNVLNQVPLQRSLPPGIEQGAIHYRIADYNLKLLEAPLADNPFDDAAQAEAYYAAMALLCAKSFGAKGERAVSCAAFDALGVEAFGARMLLDATTLKHANETTAAIATRSAIFRRARNVRKESANKL